MKQAFQHQSWSKRVGGIALMGAAVAALVACGGGGDATDATTVRTAVLQSPGSGANGCTGTEPITAPTGLGVLPTHFCSNLQGPPPDSCKAYFPGAFTAELRVDLKPEVIIQWSEDASAAQTLASLPSWWQPTVDGNQLSWSSTSGDWDVVAVILKNGGETHVYDYSSTKPSGDTKLQPPYPDNAILNWYNVCLVPKVKGDPQWCSPGYWKNHTDAWLKTGISPSALYTSYYDASTLSIKTTGKDCSDASANATVFDVISKPQCYGGEAANLVADLLSDKHPSVNYTGSRVENCPLN